MLIDGIVSGKFLYLASFESLCDGVSFGEFDADVGEFLHIFPIFHVCGVC